MKRECAYYPTASMEQETIFDGNVEVLPLYFTSADRHKSREQFYLSP